ncbi:MAG TPA: hypothetical protein VFN35_32980 [Ktedonobacteraceae bacterium]|nr:hypothetical protein [Ktedonobacteraceae bacterium]
MYRQGDLLFTVLTSLPEGLSERQDTIILEGEATGHCHRLLEGRVLEDKQGIRYLEAFYATQIVHPEHQAIHLPAGCYRVTRQREYTPEALREVRD